MPDLLARVVAQYNALQREPGKHPGVLYAPAAEASANDWPDMSDQAHWTSGYRYYLGKAVAQIEKKFGTKLLPLRFVRAVRVRSRERRTQRRVTARSGARGDPSPSDDPP